MTRMLRTVRIALIHVLYRLHLWTWPLDRSPYLWRIPSRLGLWYLRAFIRWYPIRSPIPCVKPAEHAEHPTESEVPQ